MSTVLRRVFIFSAIAAIILLVMRSAAGPFQLPGIHIAVNSPFACENIFWISILALLALHRESVSARAHDASAGFPHAHLAIGLCIIGVAFAHNVADPFLSDDYILLNAPAFDWRAFLVALSRPGGDGAFRPLGIIYYEVAQALAGRDPAKWHVIGLGLHLLNSALVFAVSWRLWRDRMSATVASLVFGLNGTRPETALWTAGNWDLPATACVLGALFLALSDRMTGRLVRLITSLLLVSVAVLCKESAYAAPLVALAFLFAYPQGPARQNLRSFVIGSGAVCAALFTWRWHLFHGPGGYIDSSTGKPAILSLHLVGAGKAIFLRIWDILLMPVNWDAPLSWWLSPAVAASTLGLLALVITNQPRPSRRVQLCLITATCFAVLPAIHLALIGQSEMGSRILYLAGVPFALLVSSLTLAANTRSVLIVAIMLAGMTGILENNLGAWHRAAIHAHELCHDPAAQPDRPERGPFEGVFLFENGFPECVEATRSAE